MNTEQMNELLQELLKIEIKYGGKGIGRLWLSQLIELRGENVWPEALEDSKRWGELQRKLDALSEEQDEVYHESILSQT